MNCPLCSSKLVVKSQGLAGWFCSGCAWTLDSETFCWIPMKSGFDDGWFDLGLHKALKQFEKN